MSLPRLPIVRLDRATAVNLELLATERPPSGHGSHKAIIVIDGEGDNDGLIAVKADAEVIEAIAGQLETIAGHLRALDSTLGRGSEGQAL